MSYQLYESTHGRSYEYVVVPHWPLTREASSACNSCNAGRPKRAGWAASLAPELDCFWQHRNLLWGYRFIQPSPKQ